MHARRPFHLLAKPTGAVCNLDCKYCFYKLHYAYNYVAVEQFHLESKSELPTGRLSLRLEFEPTGEPDVANGKGAPGRAQLYVNQKRVGSGRLWTDREAEMRVVMAHQ